MGTELIAFYVEADATHIYLIAGPSNQPVVTLDLGEPYETPDGGR